MTVPELTDAIYEVVNQINELVGEPIPFKVNGDVVVHGKDIFFIKQGHMRMYLEIKLEKFNMLLEAMHNEDTVDVAQFAAQWSELTLKAARHYRKK